MSNSRTRIQETIGYGTFFVYTILTLGFYVPVFYRKFVKNLNIMTRAELGIQIKEFATRLYTIGWCIIISPLIMVVAAVLLNAVSSLIFGTALFTPNFASPVILFLDVVNLTFGSVFGAAALTVFIGAIIFWLITVFVMAAYAWSTIYAMKRQIFGLIEHYELYELSAEYEHNLRRLRFYDSKGAMTEKFNIEAARELIKIYNDTH